MCIKKCSKEDSKKAYFYAHAAGIVDEMKGLEDVNDALGKMKEWYQCNKDAGIDVDDCTQKVKEYFDSCTAATATTDDDFKKIRDRVSAALTYASFNPASADAVLSCVAKTRPATDAEKKRLLEKIQQVMNDLDELSKVVDELGSVIQEIKDLQKVYGNNFS